VNDIDAFINSLPAYEDLSDVLTLDWHDFYVTCDWHLPFLQLKLFKRLIEDVRRTKVRRLVIGGDFFDLNSFSKFDALFKISWKDEKHFARRVLLYLRDEFDDIMFLATNHERRWLRAFERGQPDEQDIYELIGFEDKSMVTFKNQALVGNWRIVHPKTARKRPSSLARELSNIYKENNLIVTHAHLMAKERDPSNKYWLLDLGPMCDPDKTEYINFNITAHQKWNPGYAFCSGNNVRDEWHV